MNGERDRSKQEREIDEAGEESFPASDPPSWTPGEADPPPRDDTTEDGADGADEGGDEPAADDDLDEPLDESFPASDPPSWNPGSI